MPTFDELVQQYDARIGGAGPPLAPASPASVRNIEQHFGWQLPEALVALSQQSEKFGSWFAGLGDDIDAPQHIIRVNSYYRRRRTHALPRHLIVINAGFDDDLDCLITSGVRGEESAVQYWSRGITDGRRYATFLAYFESLVESLPARAGTRSTGSSAIS